jgi:heavy metal efflux system protein
MPAAASSSRPAANERSRARALQHVHDIEQTVLTTKSGTLSGQGYRDVQQGPKIRLGHMARANHMEDGRIIDEPDVIQGGVLMRKGAEEQPTLDAIHKKVDELNNGILPPGVKVCPCWTAAICCISRCTR